MNNYLSKEDFAIQSMDAGFVLKTQQQLVKDFYSSNLCFDPLFESSKFSYEEIISAIQDNLEEIMQIGERQLLQLLYQIDIPQNQFLELINQSNFSLKLSELILRREAYKVFLRSKF